MATAPFVAALPGAAIAAGLSRRWDIRLAEYRAALTKSDAYNVAVYQPAWKQMESMAGKRPPLSFTHTARSGHVATFHMTSADMDDYAMHPAYGRLAAPVRDAWRSWIVRNEQAQRLVGWQAIMARQEVLDEEEYRTQAALIAEPVPDHEALAVKLKIALTRVDGELMDGDRDALLLDLERLS